MSQTVKSDNNKVYRVVLSGGPCGGKTTGQARLCTFFESIGWKVYRVPEVSSILAGGGVKLSGSVMSDEMVVAFYRKLLEMVLQIEATFFDLAASCTENCLVICDGGAMDIRAMLTESQWKMLMTSGGWNDVELRDSRYNQVVHMVSVACAANGRRRHFSSHGGMDVKEARDLDNKLSQAWVGHPYYDVIDNSTDFDRKLVRMIAAVCDRLDIHIGDRLATDSYKRKFLIKSLPPISSFPEFQDFTVVHDYLVTPNQKMQARIRRRGINANWTYTHTIRCPLMTRDSSRDTPTSQEVPELKMQVTAREYELLLVQKDTNHHTVYKTRRCFLANNQYFQMDIYEEPCPPRCVGLILLETYTSVKGDDFVLPSFLEIDHEVTGDPAYSMYNLSKKQDAEIAAERQRIAQLRSMGKSQDSAALVNTPHKQRNSGPCIHRSEVEGPPSIVGAMDLAEDNRIHARRNGTDDVGKPPMPMPECCRKNRSGSLADDVRLVHIVGSCPQIVDEGQSGNTGGRKKDKGVANGRDDLLIFRTERFAAIKRQPLVPVALG